MTTGGGSSAWPTPSTSASPATRRPSPGALGGRRGDQPREHGPALQAPPPHGPRGWMEADQGRGQDRQHRTDGHLWAAARARLDRYPAVTSAALFSVSTTLTFNKR